jgi:hypothetical protein
MISRFVLFLCYFGLLSCTTPFSKVDFKYSNLTHMSSNACFVKVAGSPEEIVFGLSEAFRTQGATVFERQKIGYYPEQSGSARDCEAAEREINRQEFAAFEKNDFDQYAKIDRLTPYASRGISATCSKLKDVYDSSVDSWFLSVDLSPRTSSITVYQPTMSSIFLTDGTTMVNGAGFGQRQTNVTMGFETRLCFWAWKKPNDKDSTVYIHARPVNNQVVSCNGCSIGQTWWKVANGYQESIIVRNYVALLDEVSRSSKSFSQIRTDSSK